MRRLSVLKILSPVMIAMFAVAAPASGQKLFEALALAYQNNPTLEAQRAQLRAIDEGVPQALSGWRPDVRFTSDLTQLLRRTNNTSGFGTGDDSRRTYSGSFRITQNVYAGGRTEAEIRRSKHRVSAERARLKSVEQKILLDGVIGYMNVFRDQALLKLNLGNEQVLVRQLEATRDRFDVGEVTRTDVAQAESRLSRAKAERIQAEVDLEVSRALYKQIVGAAPVAVTRPEYPAALPANKQDATAQAIESNPEVVSAIYDERAAREFIAVVKGELLPSVDIVGNVSRSRNRGTPDRTIDDITVAAELTIPLYQQGSVSSRIREARQLAARNRLQIEEARRAAIENAASGFERFSAARASIKSREAEVRATSIALEGVTQEAAVGSRTVLDVLDAEQEVLDAQVSLVRDQRNAVVASYDLLAAIGRLTAQNLGLPVDVYDQERYYLQVRDKFWGYRR
jgi:TolC family type I secretion outer membrane protein